jgi:hypothetical protein
LTSKHGESDKPQNAADHEDRTTPQQHSQTLPLITEELAASRCATETERSQASSQHATTPVMPPNPIRRETPLQDTAVQGAPNVQGASSTAPAAHPSGTRPAPAAANGPEPEGEKKSEGRISATQLLAGAGAAATSSVVGGQLGVAGTVVGAGIASIITGLAVTIYGRSLDKGKEKIKEVGSKLAPAVKAQMAKGGPGAKTGTAQGVRRESAFASAPATDDTAATAPAAADESTGTAAETSQTWWQKLRRKRVLYPVTIGVAAFGIGLGAVVMAESVTGADISPGTSQISRAVSGSTGSAEETGTDGGSEGSSDSGSSGTGSGSQSGTDSNTGTVNDGSNEGGATSAGEGESEGTTTGAQTDQGSDASSSTGSDASSSTSSDGTDTSGASSTSNGSGNQGRGGSDASGSGSSSDGGSGGGSSSGGDSSAGGSSGSGASSAQG